LRAYLFVSSVQFRKAKKFHFLLASTFPQRQRVFLILKMLSIIPPLLALALTFNSSISRIHNIPAETLLNVSYGEDVKQRMDVYLPAGRSEDSTKLIVLIHGGGWNGGDKSEFDRYINELQKRLPNYAFANINYRLFNFNTGGNRFPAQENDIKAAIDFLSRKTSDYKISDQIVLLGASAGAHLALLQGYKNSEPEKVKAIVSFFGPSDLTELYNRPGNPGIPFLLNALIGTTPSENKEIYKQSSPINFVQANSPPTLLLQGGRDFLVPENQSTLLRDKLKNKGVIHQYIYYPDEGHGWRGSRLLESLDKVAEFVRTNV
jgi:acetyl esterase/lipase